MAAALAAFHVLAKTTDDQRRQRAVTILERQLVRLARLLDDLIEMERLRSGDTALHLQLMAIARQIVERHGGRIAASSAGVGCGAEFVVTLPMWRGEPRREQRRMTKAELPAHTRWPRHGIP